jgi:hypothetical protein
MAVVEGVAAGAILPESHPTILEISLAWSQPASCAGCCARSLSSGFFLLGLTIGMWAFTQATAGLAPSSLAHFRPA